MAVYTEGPAEYAEVSSTLCRSAQPSPSPYATATLIGNSKIISSDIQRFNNMFYATDIYPPNTAVHQNQNNNVNNNNNNNSSNYNRSIHSESYCNGNNSNKVNIVENRMANTMMFGHHDDISNKRNRLRLQKPQNNFHINFGSSQGEQLYVKVGDLKEGQPQVQSYTWNPQMQNFNIYENHLHRQQSEQHQFNQPKDMNAHETVTDTKTLNCD